MFHGRLSFLFWLHSFCTVLSNRVLFHVFRLCPSSTVLWRLSFLFWLHSFCTVLWRLSFLFWLHSFCTVLSNRVLFHVSRLWPSSTVPSNLYFIFHIYLFFVKPVWTLFVPFLRTGIVFHLIVTFWYCFPWIIITCSF